MSQCTPNWCGKLYNLVTLEIQSSTPYDGKGHGSVISLVSNTPTKMTSIGSITSQITTLDIMIIYDDIHNKFDVIFLMFSITLSTCGPSQVLSNSWGCLVDFCGRGPNFLHLCSGNFACGIPFGGIWMTNKMECNRIAVFGGHQGISSSKYITILLKCPKTMMMGTPLHAHANEPLEQNLPCHFV